MSSTGTNLVLINFLDSMFSKDSMFSSLDGLKNRNNNAHLLLFFHELGFYGQQPLNSFFCSDRCLHLPRMIQASPCKNMIQVPVIYSNLLLHQALTALTETQPDSDSDSDTYLHRLRLTQTIQTETNQQSHRHISAAQMMKGGGGS